MMMTVRKANERGVGEHGWLHSRHTFSFAGYFDPQHTGYRSLRVINEDKVEPARGFGKHPHEDMEIVSYVVAGELAHEDSTGTKQTLGRGGVQFMSAGSGIFHSEFNGSKTDPVHFLQIWIRPARKGTEPRYLDKNFDEELETSDWVTLLSPKPTNGAIQIGQDAVMLAARPKTGQVLEHSLEQERGAWIQMISGRIEIEGQELQPGDGAIVENVDTIRLDVKDDAELLLFDLA